MQITALYHSDFQQNIGEEFKPQSFCKMLGRIIKRNVFTTRNFRCISKGDQIGGGDNESPPETRESKLKELLENSTAFVDTTPKNSEDRWATLPYVEGTVFNKRDQNAHFERSKIDPSETSIVLFPGQGSQFVGMAKNLTKYPAARDLFEMASEILRYVLIMICPIEMIKCNKIDVCLDTIC